MKPEIRIITNLENVKTERIMVMRSMGEYYTLKARIDAVIERTLKERGEK